MIQSCKFQKSKYYFFSGNRYSDNNLIKCNEFEIYLNIVSNFKSLESLINNILW